jgi:ribosomal protein L28
MAWVCQSCERGFQTGNTRSHSNIATKRRRMINLQVRHVDGKRVRLCTRCIRTTKSKAKSKTKTAA